MTAEHLPERLYYYAEGFMDRIGVIIYKCTKHSDRPDRVAYIRADLVPDWIGVNDRLPKLSNLECYSDDVIICTKSGRVNIGALEQYDEEEEARWNSPFVDTEKDPVVAWRPLPKPFNPQDKQ